MSKLNMLFLCLFFTSSVSADFLCAKKSTKVSATGSIKVAQNLKLASGGCPNGYLPILDTDAYLGRPGIVGPQGPQGVAGILNLGSCRTVIGTSAIVGTADTAAVIADCNQTEFLLTHGGNSNSVDIDIISIGLRGFSGEGFSSGVEYEFGRNNIASTTTVAVASTAVCCAR